MNRRSACKNSSPMNRIHILFFLLISLPNLGVFSQSADNLIPRELLFKEKDRHRVTLSTNGETIYYQKTADGSDSTLYFINYKAPHSEQSTRFDGALTEWFPAYQNGLVVVLKKEKSMEVGYLPAGFQSFRKLEVFPFRRMTLAAKGSRFPNKVAVKIEAEEEAASGYYLLDVFSGNLKRLHVWGDFPEVFFDGNFSPVAALKRNEQGANVILRRSEGEWKEVFNYPWNVDMFLGGLCKIISVSNDGKTIYATDNTGKDKTSLVAIDTETGEVKELASDEQADILPFAASFDLEGKPTSVVALWADTKRHIIDSAVQQDFDFLQKEIGGNISFGGASDDDDTWLVRRIDGGPQKYYRYDRTGKIVTFLFSDYTYLDGYDLPTRMAFTVTTRDGIQLPVHVYVPFGMSRSDGIPKAPLATIIYVHGGPWAGVTHWNSWYHNRNFQLLANRGYVVINVEFRGTSGLGKKIIDSSDLQWGEAMHNDIVDVANWAVEKNIAHRRRLGIWGWSYGGYAANLAMGKAPDLFTAGISMYGITDLLEFCKLPFADNDLWRTRVGNPNTEQGAALLKQHSPSSYVGQIKNPLLITTGTLDERVPQSQADSFAKALADAGKKVIYFYYPEEVHDYRNPESWVSFWAIAEHFLNRQLGGRKEPRKGDIEKGNFKIVYGQDYVSEIE
jgi:dipeptidyl aminopeptidase/acylaminoacyl peptidase